MNSAGAAFPVSCSICSFPVEYHEKMMYSEMITAPMGSNIQRRSFDSAHSNAAAATALLRQSFQ